MVSLLLFSFSFSLFAFVWFLTKNKIKGLKNINSAALASLTLLVAGSNPKDKDLMIALITQFLAF